MKKSYNNICSSVSYGNITGNRRYVMRSTELFQAEPVSMVRRVNYGTEDNPCWKVQSDVKLLLDQKRISDMVGLDAIKAWLERIQPKDLSPKPKFSDTDLLKYIKSRYIQAPCEMLSWSEYLDRNADSVISDLKNLFSSIDSAPADPSGTESPAE